MQRMMQRRRARRETPVKVSLTPLIDTALTLLIIFMVTTPMMHNAIKVNLPQGQAQESSTDKQELTVYMEKSGKMFINGAPVTHANLIAEVKKLVGTDREKTVFVKADRAVSYGQVIQVVDQIKVVGGVQYVALSTQKHA